MMGWSRGLELVDEESNFVIVVVAGEIWEEGILCGIGRDIEIALILVIRGPEWFPANFVVTGCEVNVVVRGLSLCQSQSFVGDEHFMAQWRNSATNLEDSIGFPAPRGVSTPAIAVALLGLLIALPAFSAVPAALWMFLPV